MASLDWPNAPRMLRVLRAMPDESTVDILDHAYGIMRELARTDPTPTVRQAEADMAEPDRSLPPASADLLWMED